ncbi:polyketide cyclase/dehydrase/lipid transport protein [Nocardiopsis sp. Huas11]|uniref:SRPBCC family protein n=1 Tax=Nocardiopsis sp. Huas11 TaxID=2183912 RepID=UPI000F238BFE|nr:SRPBCC family protein [Nocardiopsis sp. Huas11]RKS06932.1 polyketide cyclase/dehydrase/lipid transport protein [Nocardiopsis sp. Huas11]
MILNVHERTVTGTPDEVWEVLALLGGEDDPLWPEESGTFRIEGGLRPGARVVHGPMRYVVGEVEPGRRLMFDAPRGGQPGFHGSHGFTLTPTGDGTLVRHELRAGGALFRLAWALVVRREHDTTLEEILDRLQRLTATA